MKRIVLHTAVMLMLSIVCFSCLDESESDYDKQIKSDDLEIQEYLEDNNITAEKLSSGVYYEVLTSNESGTAVDYEDVVTYYYHLSTLLNGGYTEYTTDSTAPELYYHDYNYTIPLGLYYGMDIMHVGEKYRFYIPGYLAYGSYSNSSFFPENTNFIVEVEVVDVMSLDERKDVELDEIDDYIEENDLSNVEELESGVRFVSLEEGTGDTVTSTSTIEFTYERTYLDGTEIGSSGDDDPVEVRLYYDSVIDGLYDGLLRMKEGGKASIIIPSDQAFGSGLVILPTAIRDDLVDEGVINQVYSLEPFSPLVYNIEVVKVQ